MKRRGVPISDYDSVTRQQLLGEEWWTSLFLNMMRPGHDTTQLMKGRRLAERGQVIVCGMNSGSVEAIVLEALGGSRKVSLWVNDLNDEWDVVFRIFAGNQTLFSRLISGEYPEELDNILKEAGIFIIPTTVMDLDYRCDCESDHHTCSHIVATYMALGKYINEDPMTLFLLRGKTREEILAGVASLTEHDSDGKEPDGNEYLEESCIDLEQADPNRFYEAGPELDLIRFRKNHIDGKESDVFRNLGPSPFRLGNSNLSTIIEETYLKAARYLKDLKDNEN